MNAKISLLNARPVDPMRASTAFSRHRLRTGILVAIDGAAVPDTRLAADRIAGRNLRAAP